jgi:hypothetical protein
MSEPEHRRILTDPGSGAVSLRLTLHELRLAFDIALARQQLNLSNGAQHHYPDTHDGLWQQTKGLVGEIAVSLYLGQPFNALSVKNGDYGAPDVPPDVQVRTVGRAGNHLTLLKKDKPDDAFVLAVYDADKSLADVTLVGWARMRDVAREAYWVADPSTRGGGSWVVSLAELRPMSALAADFAEARAGEAMARVARYKEVINARNARARAQAQMGEAAPRPQPRAPDALPPAGGQVPSAAATTASEATAAGRSPTGAATSLTERDF